MFYKNIKTGVTFSSLCKISGGDWEEVTEGETKAKIEEIVENEPEENLRLAQEKPENTGAKSEDSGYDDITVAQIKQELDAFGIEYEPRAKKQKLYDLMVQGR